MDASNFAVQFDPVRAGLIKIVEEQLLHSRKKQVFIDAEIHELNVYGALFDVSVFKLTVNPSSSRQKLVLQGQ